MPSPATLWTIGHSNHPLERFLALLQHYRLQAVADVRRFPGSRRLPQFAQAALSASLAEQGIAYCWIGELGGRRRAAPDSPNTAWRNAAFRGYADHLQSAEFAVGLERLLALAGTRRTAVMCAEVLWWRCHRALIADVLKLRGIQVLHILDETHLFEHPYSAAARRVDGRLGYGQQGEALRRPE